MNETLVGAIAGISALLGVGVREFALRRQRGHKIDADAEATRATAAETISTTVKGLLLVMQDQLDRARAEVVALRTEMDAQVSHCEAELAELRAEIADLEKRLSATEHTEEP